MNAAAIASIGIDLGKTIFHLVALDCHAGVIVRKKFSRSQLPRRRIASRISYEHSRIAT